MESNELIHWGIKGMRWGVRRYQNKDGTLTPAGQKRYNKELEKLKAEQKVLKNKQRTAAKLSKLEDLRKQNSEMKDAEKARSDPKPKKEVKRKKISEMSDEELKAHMDRLQMEKDYKDLLNSTRRETVNKGQKFVENVLSKSGENLTTQVLNHYGAKAINKVIKDIDKSVTDDVIFANNKRK